jgi:hypothetical protein
VPRHQPPVHSPISLRAVAAGFKGLFESADGDGALIDRLRADFGGSQAVLTDSGTSALTLAMSAVARSRGGAAGARTAYRWFARAPPADGGGGRGGV